MQYTPDRIGAHLRQAIGGTAKGALQGGQRPRGCPVLLAIRLAPQLSQDAVLLHRGVLPWLATAVSLHQGLDPLSIESGNQVCHRIPTLPTRGMGTCFIARAVCHRKQLPGSYHLGGRVRPGAAETLKLEAFISGEWA